MVPARVGPVCRGAADRELVWDPKGPGGEGESGGSGAASGPAHADRLGPSLFAHTGAVYLEVVGKPARAAADARYFLEWIDRLDGAVRDRGRIPGRLEPHVRAQLDAARAVYRKLVEAR